MKSSKYLFLIFFAISIIFSSCEKDNKEVFNLVGCWKAIDKSDDRTDYYTLTLNDNSTFTLRIDYGNQNSSDYIIHSGFYKYSSDMKYFWLEAVWYEGSEKAQTAFKIYSTTNSVMITSAFYATDNKFTWDRN